MRKQHVFEAQSTKKHQSNMLLKHNPRFLWPWVKTPVPPVNIQIPTRIGSKMGGEWDPIGFDPWPYCNRPTYRHPTSHAPSSLDTLESHEPSTRRGGERGELPRDAIFGLSWAPGSVSKLGNSWGTPQIHCEKVKRFSGFLGKNGEGTPRLLVGLNGKSPLNTKRIKGYWDGTASRG